MIRRLPLLFASITGTYGSLSRWWFMLQLVQSGWSNQGGPGPGDTVAVIVSGTEGGSAETIQPFTLFLVSLSLKREKQTKPNITLVSPKEA